MRKALLLFLVVLAITGCAAEQAQFQMPTLEMEVVDNFGVGLDFQDLEAIDALVYEIGSLLYNIGENYYPAGISLLTDSVTARQLADYAIQYRSRSTFLSHHIASISVSDNGRFGVVLYYIADFESATAARDTYFIIFHIIATRGSTGMIAESIDLQLMASAETHMIERNIAEGTIGLVPKN